MSPSTSSTPVVPASGLVRLLRLLFTVSTIVFVVLGLIIVFGQLLLLAFGAGLPAFDVAETLGPWAFGTSTVAGLFAFALTYFRTPDEGELHHE